MGAVDGYLFFHPSQISPQQLSPEIQQSITSSQRLQTTAAEKLRDAQAQLQSDRKQHTGPTVIGQDVDKIKHLHRILRGLGVRLTRHLSVQQQLDTWFTACLAALQKNGPVQTIDLPTLNKPGNKRWRQQYLQISSAYQKIEWTWSNQAKSFGDSWLVQ